MRKLLSCLTILLFITSAFAQDTVFVSYDEDWSDEVRRYTTDTLIFSSPMERREMLICTMLVPSGRSYTLIPYGLHPQKVEFAPCNADGEHSEGFDSIEDITLKDSTLTVRLKIYDNCCYSFLCEASAGEDGIMNLSYTGYGGMCACGCCFGLTYVFHYEKDADTIPIEAVMINGNKKTLKKIKMP